jgi:hypothetical protein
MQTRGNKMEENKTVELIPSADRLINSLRDVGYDFPTAIADIVDNSIDAGSTIINIDIDYDDEDAWIRINDNGKGMNCDEILEAMRFGSELYCYTGNGLGKFGLGLKTASISQCRRLIVSSQSADSPDEQNAYCWDLDHIKKTNKWEVIDIGIHEIENLLSSDNSNSSGTTVIWQNLDRILEKKKPNNLNTKIIFAALCRTLEEHLSMVFHRFLAGELPTKKVVIKLNGNALKPWDPFFRDEENSFLMESTKLKLELETHTGIVSIHPYVLPHQNGFSSREVFNKASGPKKWNRQQGFYIYRADRLIQSGGWCGLRTYDEHTKLARVALDFSPILDEGFKINVSKMKVELPSQISKQVDEAIKPVLKKAQEVYRKNNPTHKVTPPVKNTDGVLPPVGIADQKQPRSENPIGSTLDKKLWSLDEFEHFLIEQATEIEKMVIENLFKRLRKNKRVLP